MKDERFDFGFIADFGARGPRTSDNHLDRLGTAWTF